MSLPEQVKDLARSLAIDHKQIKTWLFGSPTGDLTSLDTTTKVSIVDAINELYTTGGIGSGSLPPVGVDEGDLAVLGPNGRFIMDRLAAGIPDGTQFVRDDGTLSQIPVDPDMARSAPGRGGLVFLIDGQDTPTGDPNEVILKQASSLPGGSGGESSLFPGLDMSSGNVGCTVADASLTNVPMYDSANLSDPYRTHAEASGNVLVVSSNTRIAARFKVYATRIDKVSWMVGDGSTANVVGTIAIVRPSDGTILAQASVNLTPSSVTAVYGSPMSWTLTSPLTDLNPGDEFVIVTQHTSGTIRYYARGMSGLFNQAGLRAANELVRSGGLPSAPALSGTSLVGPIDFSGTAPNNAGTATGWIKRPIPVFLFSRTS